MRVWMQVMRVYPEDHLQSLVAELKKGLEDSSLRLCASILIATLADSRPITDYVESLLQSLVSLMSEEDPDILMECWKAMKSVASTVAKEMRPTFVRFVTLFLTLLIDNGILECSVMVSIRPKRENGEKTRQRRPSLFQVSAFPKASHRSCLSTSRAFRYPCPALREKSIYEMSVIKGASGDLRESSATGLGDLVSVMDAASLKPFVGLIMGPLIRIINDRFPWQVKLAILKTMGQLIFKAGDEMRKFVAALQPIFLKCLPDPTESIRDSAAKNLGHLTRLSSRIDPLINNLGTFAVKTEPPMRNAYLTAMAEALTISGEKISPPVLQKTGTVLLDLLSSTGPSPDDVTGRSAAYVCMVDENEDNTIALAVCFGSFCKHCAVETMTDVLQKRLSENSVIWTERLLTAVLMATIAKHSTQRLQETDLFPLFIEALTKVSLL